MSLRLCDNGFGQDAQDFGSAGASSTKGRLRVEGNVICVHSAVGSVIIGRPQIRQTGVAALENGPIYGCELFYIKLKEPPTPSLRAKPVENNHATGGFFFGARSRC